MKYVRPLPISLIAMALIAWNLNTASATPPAFVTICHAAGLASGPANWVTLTLPYQAVYGNAGHFYENGTPRAGHEQDYLGPCATATPTEVPSATPTNTEVPTATPTETSEPTGTATASPTATLIVETGTPSGTPGNDGTPTVTPELCDEPCGWMFSLIGPDGQTALFASFSQRENGGWYTPYTGSQLKCLGWVAVKYNWAAGYPLFGNETLIHCEGGSCFTDPNK